MMRVLRSARNAAAAVVFAFVVLTCSATPALAATSSASTTSQSALTVSPAILEDVVNPGQPKVVTVKVSNITDFPLPISSRARSFTPLESVDNNSLRSKFDASKWFTITEPDFILQPKQIKTVSITITAPADAEPGGHYATIYFTPLIPETALTPSTAYLSAQVGTLAFLIVPGNITEKLSVTSFTTAGLHQSRSIDFTVKLKNSGNVHLAPNGRLLIKDWHGKTVGRVPLKIGIVLPGTEKVITASWHSNSFIGKYSATTDISYGTSHTAPAVQTSFWVLPWGLLLGIIILIAFVIFVTVKTRGRWRKAWQALRGR